MKLTAKQREELDQAVLAAAAEWSPNATYVLRNRLARIAAVRMDTPTVLRSCRRLEKSGLLQQFHNSGYAVMLVWKLTPAGLAALQAARSKE